MNMNSLKGKNFWSRFRMPHVFTLLFAIIVLIGVVSLVLAYSGVTYTDSKGVTQPILGAGILSWIAAPIAGMKDAIWIIVFLLVLGAFIYFVVKSQALEAVMGRLGLKLKGTTLNDHSHKSGIQYYLSTIGEFFRHTWLIFPLVMFFAFCGTSYGMAEESLAFYAIIIPLTIAAGFDMWTGFLIVFAGAGIGVMASTINPFSVLTANSTMKDAASAANKAAIDAAAGNGVAWRWITWGVLSLMTAFFVMTYAFKVKLNQSKAKFADMFEIHKKEFGMADAQLPTLTKRRIITSLLFVFTFIVMVLGMMQWDSIIDSTKPYSRPLSNFDADNFSSNKSTMWFYNKTVINKLADGGYDWTFGQWYWTAIISLFLISAVTIAIINRNSEVETMEGFNIGAKDMISVAFAVGISRGISVIMKNTGMQVYFSEKLGNVLKSIKTQKNIVIPLVSYFLFIPLTFLIPSTSGLASATFGVIGNSVASAAPAALSGTVTAYAMGAGFANMFVPTYAVVIGAIGITKISFSRFFKSIASFLGLAFVAGIVMIVIGGAITDGKIF